METTRLAYFIALEQTGSVTAAAEQLHVTPSAVSKAIRSLEVELDAELVIRNGRGVSITDAGRHIARRAEEILDSIETLRDHNALRVGNTPAYRFAASGHLATSFYAEFVRSFHDCDVTLAELDDLALVEAIQLDRVDIGVVARELSAEGISSEHVCDMPMGVFARAHVMQTFGTDLERVPFTVPGFRAGDDGARRTSRSTDGWPSGAPARVHRFPVATPHAALELCISGHAAAYLPRFVARRHNARTAPSHRIEEIALPPAVQRQAVQHVHVLRRTTDLDLHCVGKVAGPLTNVVTQ